MLCMQSERTFITMERENFSSRLGFILISAGCAIGLGNVWKFPYICGMYGGAAFIVMYLIFLALLGLPILICEFSVGRASRKGMGKAFDVLEQKGTKWHRLKWMSIIGSYLLMMFYTMVGGWMIYYAFLELSGKLSGLNSSEITATFNGLLSQPEIMFIFTFFMFNKSDMSLISCSCSSFIIWSFTIVL